MRLLLLVPVLVVGFSLPASAGAPLEATPSLHVEVQHTLARTEARTRIEQLLDYWRTRFGVRTRWNGDRALIAGRVMGVEFRGWVEIGDRSVDAAASDPGALFRGSVRDYVQAKLAKYLHPRYQEGGT